MEENIRWLGFGAVIRATGVSLILPFAALYLRNVLGLGYAEIGILSAVIGILPLSVVSFAGVIVDRVGRRRVLLLSLVVEASAILVAAYAMEVRSLVGLVLSVITVSTAGSVAGPAISAYVADFAHGSERTLGFTYIRIGWNVGFTLGVLSGGALIGFLGFAVVGFAAGGVLVASTSFLALGLEPSGYDRDRAAGVPRGEAGTTYDLRNTVRVLGRDRVFLALCGAVALGSLTMGQWGVTFPLYANTVLHLPYAILGMGLALNGVLVVVAQAPTTRAAVGHRHTTALTLGLLLYVAGFLLVALVALVPALVLAIFFGAVFVLTMGENVESIPTTTLPSNLAPATEVGAYNGTFYAIVGVGQVLAPTLGGLVLAATLSPLLTWGLLGLPTIPALLLLRLYVVPRIRADANRA
ncbi:MAG TPA: MFS transporter [Thermoplasmata archaeon]|nr:MFS transporter [Thermoplasmata archaeon]